MPKSLFQEIVLTVMMVFVMVYAMICYNMSLAMGGLSNQVFLGAFRELLLMMPIAFVLDFFVVGPIAKKITFKIFNPKEDKILFVILSISICSIWLMCPLMSAAATILFKGGLIQKEFAAKWLETTAFNYPMAAFWQLLFAGPLVRKVFGLIFRQKSTAK